MQQSKEEADEVPGMPPYLQKNIASFWSQVFIIQTQISWLHTSDKRSQPSPLNLQKPTVNQDKITDAFKSYSKKCSSCIDY